MSFTGNGHNWSKLLQGLLEMLDPGTCMEMLEMDILTTEKLWVQV